MAMVGNSDNGNAESASDVIKYEKKLSNALKKRKLCSSEAECADFDISIRKYEKKIAKARKRHISSKAGSITGPDSNDDVNGESREPVAPVDKSGMTLLLFYAYVEPIWKPAQHTTMIEWARSTLENNG